MGRLFTDGAEFQDNLFWSSIGSGSGASAGQKRSGTHSYTASGINSYLNKILPSTYTEWYSRIAVYISATHSSLRIPAFRSGSNEVSSLRFTTQYPTLYVNNVLVATSGILVPLNTWTLLETHFKIDNSGIFELKVEGVNAASYSGDTLITYSSMDGILWNNQVSQLVTYVDDLALNDITGVVDNSWCGDGRVGLLKTNANGDNIDFVPSAGSNYENVDDIPNDGDTTYNQGLVSGEYDLYNLEASGLSNVSILRGWIEARVRKMRASSETVLLGLKTDGTEYWNDSHDLQTNYSSIRRDHTINPKTGSPWTVADLDALQIGMKVE